ncbi:hypothetical protein PC129_g12176 [Phytophthora cactorum]|uniref:Uncharacterized protein n=1 Tax=Phytophthora cactorum TaxID=29920 RepID=A0A8T1G5L8_9STRA|nr:hypothetical protein Pcac1_g18544 [Phytophthora cactorum]KAG2831240.1 hypothetical protein PC112_g7356 [Phytophthora cactorum]KAG2833846.1 hypothetical protein PC111_g6062 [Phytophthora cactorum]KAG2861180.1 hypothetical protein PC113_g7408 [Phytophthora cactorum]KAG2916573.1 hypothetical protein PC114_g7434 [Phytophthora cactorum]
MLEQTVEESAETVHRSFGKCCNERHFVRTARRRPLPCLVGKKHLKGAAEKQKESFATRPTRGFGSLGTPILSSVLDCLPHRKGALILAGIK